MTSGDLSASERARAILAAARAALRAMPDADDEEADADADADAAGWDAADLAGATSRDTPRYDHARERMPPRRPPVPPRYITAARMLLAGRSARDVAAALGVHAYTVSRWRRDPRFEAELHRQIERQAPPAPSLSARNEAQQNPTSATPARNEANVTVPARNKAQQHPRSATPARNEPHVTADSAPARNKAQQDPTSTTPARNEANVVVDSAPPECGPGRELRPPGHQSC